MKSGCISYSQAPKSSALLLDYIYDHHKAAHFYNGSPYDTATYARLAGDLQEVDVPRAPMVEILRSQNIDFGCGEQTLANIDRLSRPGTFAVVTGQQAGLFSGPAFTLYKALTALRLAQEIEKDGLDCVPVFWLATEDHDLEEVAETYILDDDYHLVPLREEGELPAPQCSVGYVKLSPRISETLRQLESLLPAGEARENLLWDLRECYRPGESWGRAFGCFLARLFRPWGVILLNPLDEAVHRLCRPVYGEAIRQAGEFRNLLKDRSNELMRTGYHAQVHVAENSTLLFLERGGNRLALQHRGENSTAGYFCDEAEDLSVAELESLVNDHPLSFSPNVLLRPVVQDTLLPTIAYVAGPSELAYFAQAQVIYSAFSRPMPVIFPRAAFSLVDARCQRLLEKYHLFVEDIWQGEEHLNRKIAATGFASGWAERFDQSERDLAQLLQRMRRDIEFLDPTLLDALKHTEEKIKYQVERLKGKVSRAAIGKSEVLTRHEQMLERFITPRKDLQERQISGIYFLSRGGYELLNVLLSQIDVKCPGHQVMFY